MSSSQPERANTLPSGSTTATTNELIAIMASGLVGAYNVSYEQRLFSHLGMNWRGRPATGHGGVVDLICATITGHSAGYMVEQAPVES